MLRTCRHDRKWPSSRAGSFQGPELRLQCRSSIRKEASSSASHVQGQPTVLWFAQIVIEPRNLKWAEGKHAVRRDFSNWIVGALQGLAEKQRLQARQLNFLDSRNIL